MCIERKRTPSFKDGVWPNRLDKEFLVFVATLKVPDVKRGSKVRLHACSCCGGSTFKRWQQVKERNVRLVNLMHRTASVFINDDESGLHHDYDVWLEKVAPQEPVSQYRRKDMQQDNADAHIKRQTMG